MDLDDLYSNISLFSPSSTQALVFQLPGTIFMYINQDFFISTCIEGFLYGKISILFCSLPCTFAKEVHLMPSLGLYSRILAIYFQCQSKESTGRMGTIVFYAICLLYILSTLSFVSDFVALILEVSNSHICSKNIIFYQLCRHILPRQIFFPLKMSKSYYPVVVTSLPKVS